MELLLASQSPRRRELFKLIGLDFSVVQSDTDEAVDFSDPAELVEQLSLRKAQAVKAGRENCCVVGSDTVVYLNGEILGKPQDRQDAYRILKKLSGHTHTVYTGLAVLTDGGVQLCHDVAQVTFETLTDEEIWRYIDSGEPMDKAGAYGIQGTAAVFVRRIEGCYFTIVGLPLPQLYKMLKNVGIKPKSLS